MGEDYWFWRFINSLLFDLPRCLAGQDAVLGKHHKDTLKTLNDLGNVNLGMKKHDEALDYFKRAKKGWESVLGKVRDCEVRSDGLRTWRLRL